MSNQSPARSPRRIGILLFDEMEELDAVGPWEVLAWWVARHPEDGWAVTTFSADGGTVRCAKGMRIVADHSTATIPALEILIHPGGQGTRALSTDLVHLEWLRAQRARVPILASVCTGALVLAAAGLLAGRPATTYHRSFEELRALDPTVQPRPGARFVDDGEIVTSAGVSAGIEMALHLVSRLAGPERAEQVRAGIEYAPAAAA